MEKALQACSKIQVEVERYLKAHMNFGLSDVEVDEYQANAQYRKAQTACRQCVYLGTNIILRYEDLQYKKQTDFVITSGEKNTFYDDFCFRTVLRKRRMNFIRYFETHRKMYLR